jgi:preprotein translocase subunit SecG
LIIIILIQAGRGGGLVEGFSNVESMFGPKTNTFLTRTTATLSILFFLTCLSLAFLSSRQSRSLMENVKVPEAAKEEASKDNKSPKVTENTPAQKTETAAPVQKTNTAAPVKQAQTPEVPKTE